MSIHLLFYRDLSPNAARHTPVPAEMTELEKQAVERVRRARVKEPESVILAFVRSTGGPDLPPIHVPVAVRVDRASPCRAGGAEPWRSAA